MKIPTSAHLDAIFCGGPYQDVSQLLLVVVLVEVLVVLVVVGLIQELCLNTRMLYFIYFHEP